MERTSLNEILGMLNNLKEEEMSQVSEWSPYKIFVHCAKTIEYAMTGYPIIKPVFVRYTVGKVVFRKFMKQGYMKHSLIADVPGSPPIEEEGTFQEGKEILIRSIEKFKNYKGELFIHLLFGKLNKEQYDMYFAMHIADHLKSKKFYI